MKNNCMGGGHTRWDVVLCICVRCLHPCKSARNTGYFKNKEQIYVSYNGQTLINNYIRTQTDRGSYEVFYRRRTHSTHIESVVHFLPY